jgi:putative effector of murein hydrolase
MGTLANDLCAMAIALNALTVSQQIGQSATQKKLARYSIDITKNTEKSEMPDSALTPIELKVASAIDGIERNLLARLNIS